MKSNLLPKFDNEREREAFWFQVCQEWMTSGLSKFEFCTTRKISKSGLYKWLGHFNERLNSKQPSRLNAVTNNKSKPKPSFFPVQVETNAATQATNLANNEIRSQFQKLPPAELVFPNGIKLVFNQEFNANLLSQLMAVVG